jgi:hypothetical protein
MTPAVAAWRKDSPEGARKLDVVVSWIDALDTRLNPDKQFRYKPLLLLAVLNVLETSPNHGNRFGFDELWEAFRSVAREHGFDVSKRQFSQPYLNMRRDVDPEPVWCIETTTDSPEDIDNLPPRGRAKPRLPPISDEAQLQVEGRGDVTRRDRSWWFSLSASV